VIAAETLPGVLFAAAGRFGDRPAVIDRGITLSFRALATLVEEAARAWMSFGVGPGDRVAIWAPNGWAWQVAALGAQLAGGVLVPINTRFKGREAAAILSKTRAHALVVQHEFLGTNYLAELRQGGLDFVDEGGTVVALGPRPPSGVVPWSSFLARAHDVERSALAARAGRVSPADPSDIIFTSGTTGRPKGVVATHAQTVQVFRTWSELVGLGPDDRYLVVNPYFHTFGYKAGWLACLISGATCLPEPLFDVPTVLQRIARDRVTVLPGPPTLYQSLLDHPGRAGADLSSLRLAVTGAAVVPVELVRRMREQLGFATVLTAYGLTEATGVVTLCRPGDDLETLAWTSGRAIPGVEVNVVGPDGAERPRGEAGEVWVRGYNVMPGYFEDREETAAAVDGEGWLHTGDIGVMTPEGNLRITDRLKDMFIVGGFNAYPAEIEDLLLGHRGVQRVAVVGAPDARLGEVGVAFVVPRPGARLTADELTEWARGRMANYKVPRHFEVVTELPLTALGKVQKPLLRARARELVQR
jgi:acyl-CoA synthetase (AMP-forming)/AMP-acid ligase II